MYATFNDRNGTAIPSGSTTWTCPSGVSTIIVTPYSATNINSSISVMMNGTVLSVTPNTTYTITFGGGLISFGSLYSCQIIRISAALPTSLVVYWKE